MSYILFKNLFRNLSRNTYMSFRNRNYTEKEFRDFLNELECFLEHKRTEQWGKRVEGRWNPEDESEQKERNEMIALAKELADIDVLARNCKIREEILYVLSEIFSVYDLQGKGLVNLDKLRAAADYLEEPLQEYLEEIL